MIKNVECLMRMVFHCQPFPWVLEAFWKSLVLKDPSQVAECHQPSFAWYFLLKCPFCRMGKSWDVPDDVRAAYFLVTCLTLRAGWSVQQWVNCVQNIWRGIWTSSGCLSFMSLYGVSFSPPGNIECFRNSNCSSFLPVVFTFLEFVTIT